MKYVYTVIISLLIFSSCKSKDVITEDSFKKQTAQIHPSYMLSVFSYEKSTMPAIILVDPIFIDKRILFLDKNSGLIGYLNKKKYPVWVLHFKDYENQQFNVIAEEALTDVIGRVKKKSKTKGYIIGGLSLGGQMVLDYLITQDDPDLMKVFFIGTGFEYDYENSFIDIVNEKKMIPSDISNACHEDSILCKRYISIRSNDIRTRFIYERAFNYLPKFDYTKSKLDKFQALNIPTFFISGKFDSISPSMSIYPIYSRKKGNNEFLELSVINGAAINYDHLSLFLHEHAEEDIYTPLAKWLRK